MEVNRLKHVGMIMDGNRRWAKQHYLKSVLNGHESGVNKFMEACQWCLDEQIPYLTVYAFSTENWNRSEYEVSGLFKIMEHFYYNDVETCIQKGIRIKVVGDRSRLNTERLELLNKAEDVTKGGTNLVVQIAISYGGKNEITRAIKHIVTDAGENKISVENIDEQLVESYLDTSGIPMIDMVIRTGGNHRLSNFFIWQAAYAEIYFTDTLWPDFSKTEFLSMLDEYSKVSINLGK